MIHSRFSARSMLVLLGALLPTAALAHDTWLASTESVVRAGRTIAFELTSAHRFPKSESAPKPERIAVALCRQDGAELPLEAGVRGPRSLRLDARPKTDAALVCRVDLAPRELVLDTAKVDGYLKEIDAPARVREAWAASPSPKRWVETYSKHTKSIVPGTSARPDAGSPLGAPLEFVSDVPLSTGRVDGPLSFRVLKDGEPRANLSVELVAGRDSRGTWQRTDDQGRVSFARPAPGRWMVRATDLHATDVAQGTWESHFATLVFDVVAAPR